jgi:ornithine cyclodeaminase
MTMHVFNASETAALLPYRPMIDRLDAAYRGGVVTPERVHHTVEGGGEPDKTLILMPAWQDGGPIGVKLVNVVPGNRERGLPSIAGIYVLFDGLTGQPVAILDGAELTARRTAAVGALAANYLAKKNARTHLILGAGAIAPHLIHAHRAVRPIDTTLIWARRPEEAERIAAQARRVVSGVEAVTDLPEAAGRADIVSCATLASEPILHGAWLSSGVHVDLMGAFRPHMREADDDVVRGAIIYVDAMHGALHDAGELRMPLEQGVIRRDDIRGDLAALCRAGHAARTDEREKTLFKSVGSAQSDYAVAAGALEAIRTRA